MAVTIKARRLPARRRAPPPATVTFPEVTQVRGGKAGPVAEIVAVETPVALFYNCVSHVVMMATPADLEEFAIGFSLSERIVAGVDEIEDVVVSPLDRGLKVSIRIPAARAKEMAGRERNLAGRTGCGLCGVTAIEQALRPLPAVPRGRPITASAIGAAIRSLPDRQSLNQVTGAIHAAAFVDRGGAVLAVREDVGRHNALDKLIGAVARAHSNPADGFVVVTSRCSMEMVQKTATLGFPLIASISAPTSLAIELAQGCGLTLLAFARGDRFNAYAHGVRVVVGA
ncbi:MAG: formate dehydrogenase accessory sulfurtransferase FdhD [Alphaproteobacteria bacterium]|nr:formate dehydrogenase accessory sulfurtransferase FdhD [Alphaproteobacteria bacterium]